MYIVTNKEEDLKRLRKGIKTLATIVGSTLGPLGKNVIIRRPNGKVHVTKDGVTVAKDVQSNDPIEQMGIDLVREVSNNTLLEVGDGTTTATIIANAFIEAVESRKKEIVDVTTLKTEINEIVEDLIGIIKNQSLDIKDNYEATKAVATISANNDEFLGKLIADAIKKIGYKGNILLEDAKGENTFVDITEGFYIERGISNRNFFKNKSDKRIEIENPYILFYDKRIDNIKQIANILTTVHKQKEARPLVIVSETLEGSALKNVLYNHKNGSLQIAAVVCPGYANRRIELLEDMALYTDGKFINTDEGMSLHTARITDLGIAEKVVIEENSTIIIGGRGNADTIKNKIKELEEVHKTEKSKYKREKLEERIASLSDGVAVIHVGGSSEVEMKEAKDRIDDALQATKAALKEGVTDGGGVTLLNTILEYKTKNRLAYEILVEALTRPFFTIYGEEVVFNPHGSNTTTNLKTKEKGKGISVGVIDPTKVVTTTLKNAVSIGTMYLTTAAIITQSELEYETRENFKEQWEN